MPTRKMKLVEGEIYHVFNRGIGGFNIFNDVKEYTRMKEEFSFYKAGKVLSKFSMKDEDSQPQLRIGPSSGEIVKILAYCLMPTHLHLILRQQENNGISIFVNLILKSYSRYFSEKYKRKGPLWEGRFKNILVKTDEQLLHLTRYIHLNPVSSCQVNLPSEWPFSSYREYLGLLREQERICAFSDYLDIEKNSYRQFVESRIDYQRQLEVLKHLLLE